MKKSILAVSAFLGLLVSCTVEISPGSNSTSKEPTTPNTTSSTLPSTSQTPSSSTVIPSTSNTSSSSSSIEERDYLTIEEALVAANDELNFADYSNIVDGTQSYKVRGIVNRIDLGADGKNNLYIESLSSTNQPVGLYVYGASDMDNASLGTTIEVTGPFKNFRGCVEIIPTSIETIVEEGTHLVTPSNITVNELLSSNYLNQGCRTIIKNAKVVAAPSINLAGDTSGYYPTVEVGGEQLGIKVDTRSKSNTTTIANYFIENLNNEKLFTMEGNITFHSGVYKLCVGQLEDITLQDNQEHVHQYTFLPYDSSYHYAQCTCGDQRLEAHESSPWIVDQEATTTSAGKKHKECTKCKFVLEEETIPQISSSEDVVIDFYAVNDFHGAVKDSSSNPGIEKMSTKLKELVSTKENAVLLSSGDMWQGSIYSNNTRGNLVTEWMNQMNFVSMTIGNHEFDWGEETIIKNRELANFPTLGINVYSKETKQRVSYLDASTMIEKGGIKIGIIGAIGNCYSSISASKVANVEFKTGTALANLVINEARRLKDDENCQIVVYSLHDSIDESGYQNNISTSKYVDIVFEGHTHAEYAKKDDYGIYHIQSGSYNSGISHATLTYNPKTKSVDTNLAENISTKSWLDSDMDENTTALFEKYSEAIGNPKEHVGYNAKERNSNELRTTGAKLMMEYGQKLWGDQYDIVLGGGYLSVRSPFILTAGFKTVEDIFNLFPFDNDIILCSATGAFLKKYYMKSTNSNYFISYNTGYSSSSNLSDTQIYYFVTDTFGSDYYMYGNGYRLDNQFKIVEQPEEACYLRDLMGIYIRKGGYSS